MGFEIIVDHNSFTSLKAVFWFAKYLLKKNKILVIFCIILRVICIKAILLYSIKFIAKSIDFTRFMLLCSFYSVSFFIAPTVLAFPAIVLRLLVNKRYPSLEKIQFTEDSIVTQQAKTKVIIPYRNICKHIIEDRFVVFFCHTYSENAKKRPKEFRMILPSTLFTSEQKEALATKLRESFT